MKTYALIGLFSLSSLRCQAQETQRLIGISIWGNALQLKDRAVSRQRYGGGSAALSLGFSQENSRHFWFARGAYEKGFYSAGQRFNYAQRHMDHTEVRGDVGYLGPVGRRAEWQFFAGELLSLIIAKHEVLKFTNSKIALNGALDIGPAMAVRRAFRMWQKDWRFQGLLSMPLVGYLLRPEYGLPSFNGSVRMSWQTLNHYFRLRARSTLHYEMPSGNALFLSYEWEYRAFKLPNALQEAAQRLAIGILISI